MLPRSRINFARFKSPPRLYPQADLSCLSSLCLPFLAVGRLLLNFTCALFVMGVSISPLLLTRLKHFSLVNEKLQVVNHPRSPFQELITHRKRLLKLLRTPRDYSVRIIEFDYSRLHLGIVK